MLLGRDKTSTFSTFLAFLESLHQKEWKNGQEAEKNWHVGILGHPYHHIQEIKKMSICLTPPELKNDVVFGSHGMPFPAMSDWRSQVAENCIDWAVKAIELSWQTCGCG